MLYKCLDEEGRFAKEKAPLPEKKKKKPAPAYNIPTHRLFFPFHFVRAPLVNIESSFRTII